MTGSVSTHPSTAPPDDPVRAALDDPDFRRRLLAHACATLRGKLADAEDVVQIVCERAWERRHMFDPARATVSGWLFGFAVNVCREMAKRRGPTVTDPKVLTAVAATASDPDLADVRVQVERHLSKLSPDEQAVVRLRHFDDLDLAEAAVRLKIGYPAARMRYSRAVRRLRELAGATRKEERS